MLVSDPELYHDGYNSRADLLAPSALSFAALEMFKSFAASSPPSTSTAATRSPFVYISAEDIFRPFVPERYISTKRAAERAITDGSLASMATGATRAIRPVFIRPSESAVRFLLLI